jgi:hypothetical protein
MSISSPKGSVWIFSSVVLALGFIIGSFLISTLVLKARLADRSVTVRGLAERNVMADLATWTLAYSAQGANLKAVQDEIDQDTKEINAFFRDLGFTTDALRPSGVGVNQRNNNYGKPVVNIRQRITLRTNDIALAQKAVSSQFDLIRRGVVLEEGSGMNYTFTKLDEVKPDMVAEATQDARRAAQQFAQDSGANVGGIKSATQGYFSIRSRDGDSGGYGVSDTPYKKVRVVTTVNFYLR